MQEPETVQTESEPQPPKPCKVLVTLPLRGKRAVACLLGVHNVRKIILPAVTLEVYERIFFEKSEILADDIRTIVVQLVPGYAVEDFVKGMCGNLENVQVVG